jgi:hypothetical protein
MVVGGHEGVRVNADVTFSRRVGHRSTEMLGVIFVADNRVPIQAAGKYVEADTRYENATWIGHASEGARNVLAVFPRNAR